MSECIGDYRTCGQSNCVVACCDESERALTLIEMKADSRIARRLALAATLVFTGWATSPLLLGAQVVKAPRYSGAVEAPTPRLNLPALPPAITPHGTVVEDVVVRVNDQIISRSDVERSEAQLQQEAQQEKLSPADLAVRQRDMLRDMIDQQLLLSKAKEMGLNADADVVRRLDDLRKQYNMATLDELEKAATAQGVSFEDFKAQIRNQILTQQVVRDEVGRRLQVTQADETKYYNEHAKDFDRPEQVRLSEILIPLPENATPAQITQAEAKANDVKSKVLQGGDFADLAKKFSGGPTAAQGGELGLFKRGALAPVLEEQTFPLKVGDSSQPVRTRQGFVILKVTEHDTAGPAAMKEVEPQIQEAMYMQAMQPALRVYLTKLREESFVELQQGFVDSGSSAQQTKPLYTAYAPPVVKKKKVAKKARFDRGTSSRNLQARQPVSSPDNGGRSITGPDALPDAQPAANPQVAAASAVDSNTGLAVINAPRGTGKRIANGKAPKAEKREKIRFGQAPRNSIAAASEDAAVSTDAAAARSETVPGARPAAPGAVMASGGGAGATVESSSADLDDNPLTPQAPERKKVRFAAQAKQVKDKKVKTLSAKQQEKVLAKPGEAPAEEKADSKVQAAPIGLAGNAAVGKPKKVKKPKHVKGTPKPQKERLQEKVAAPKPAAPVVDQTASPTLAPTGLAPSDTKPTAPATPQTVPNSSVPRSVPNQPDTTLPPVTQPTPGSPQQGQPVPGVQPPA